MFALLWQPTFYQNCECFPIPKFLVLNILELWEFALGICGPLAYEGYLNKADQSILEACLSTYIIDCAWM